MAANPQRPPKIWRTIRSVNEVGRSYALTAVLLITVALPQAARSDPSGLDCPVCPDNVSRARKLAGALFTDASKAFDEQRFLPALKLFLCSMEVIEHKNTLINIEKTLGKISDPEAVAALLQQYVEEMPEGTFTPEMEELLAGLMPEEAAEEEADDDEAPAEVVEETTPPQPVVTQPQPSPDGSRRIVEISGWSSVTLAATTFITAIALQGVAASARNKAKEAVRYDDFLKYKERNAAFQTGASVTFVASALFAGLGIAQLVMSRERLDGPERGVTVSIVPGPGSVGVKGEF